MKKRILMSKGGSVGMVVMGILMMPIYYSIAKNSYDTFSEAFSDPLIIPVIFIAVSPFLCACMHYVVTDEGIKGVAPKMIRFSDIIEVGVNYGGKYDKNPAPKVTYIKYRRQDNTEKYKFLQYFSKELYDYLAEKYKVNFVEDTIDRKRRNELEQRGSFARKTDKVLAYLLVFFLLPGFVLLILYLSIKDGVWGGSFGEKAAMIIVLAILATIGRSLFGQLMTMTSRIRYDENNVYIKFPFHRQIVYCWDELQQVCICYLFPENKRIVSDIVICFVKKGVNRHPIKQRWPIETGFKYRELLCVMYSEETLEEVKKYCPHEIVDLRGTGTYYH